jgi:dihydrolipoamide dehydrogenase
VLFCLFYPSDPRIVDSTGALKLTSIPKRMLVIGGGIIGLEMATVYSSLGAKIDIVELSSHLMAGADLVIRSKFGKMNELIPVFKMFG